MTQESNDSEDSASSDSAESSSSSQPTTIVTLTTRGGIDQSYEVTISTPDTDASIDGARAVRAAMDKQRKIIRKALKRSARKSKVDLSTLTLLAAEEIDSAHWHTVGARAILLANRMWDDGGSVRFEHKIEGETDDDD